MPKKRPPKVSSTRSRSSKKSATDTAGKSRSRAKASKSTRKSTGSSAKKRKSTGSSTTDQSDSGPSHENLVDKQTDVARYFGIDARAVRYWLNERDFPRRDDGRFDLEAISFWRKNKPDGQVNDTVAGKIREQTLEQAIYKTKESARADRREEAVSIDAVEYELWARELLQATRDAILDTPDVFRRELCPKCRKKIGELVELLEKTLRELSNLPFGPQDDDP